MVNRIDDRDPVRRLLSAAICLVGLACGASYLGSQIAAAGQFWQIPPSATRETSPIAPDDKVLKKGRSIFMDNCATCHGPAGKGDGPTGDPQHPPADLTDATRMAANPDGVMFYKIWNGRKAPDMPAFKARLTKDDVWTVVEYVKTLHPAPPTP